MECPLTGFASEARFVLLWVMVMRCCALRPDAPHLAPACVFCSGTRLRGAETDPPPPLPDCSRGAHHCAKWGNPAEGVGGFSP